MLENCFEKCLSKRYLMCIKNKGKDNVKEKDRKIK